MISGFRTSLLIPGLLQVSSVVWESKNVFCGVHTARRHGFKTVRGWQDGLVGLGALQASVGSAGI
jgi:hypothetical protein